MYPDEQTALAYTALVEFIDGNGISKSEAFQALTILSERIRASSGYCDCKTPAFAPFLECGNCGKPPRTETSK